MSTYNDKIKMLADLLCRPGPNFALTGAGISTESGIPDYRSSGTGLWTRLDPAKTASVSSLMRDPARFYEFNLDRWMQYDDVLPNDGHLGISLLEEKGYIVGVVTQNIDSLHVKAGSRRVWEVHGHLRSCRCVACGRGYPMSELAAKYRAGENPPLCQECSSFLRPDVVLFEDPMPEDYNKAVKALTGCQTLVVAGSSLQVHPVANLPRLARRLVIINREPTPWDEDATLVINESTGMVFRDLLAGMGIQ